MKKEKVGLKNFIFFVIPLILVVYACSSQPSEADARKVFENSRYSTQGNVLGDRSGWAEEIKNGTIRIQSFKKVNGLSSEVKGAKFYTIEYESKIEFLQNYHNFHNSIKKGDVKVIYGKMGFVKKEKGWDIEHYTWNWK